MELTVPEEFTRDLSSLLNRLGIDAAAGVPDYLLAQHLSREITSLATSVRLVREYDPEPR